MLDSPAPTFCRPESICGTIAVGIHIPSAFPSCNKPDLALVCAHTKYACCAVVFYYIFLIIFTINPNTPIEQAVETWLGPNQVAASGVAMLKAYT
jgi:hypothetical protein